MLTVCYGAKGGQGVTTVTAGLAVIEASPSLVALDAGGDLPAALGATPEPDGPGLADVLAGPGPLDVEALARLGRSIGAGPVVVPAGGPLDAVPGDRWETLGGVLGDDERHWLVDAGTVEAAAGLAPHAQRVLLVVANCYMAFRRARRHPVRPTGVVFVEDLQRPLSLREVAAVVDAPVVVTIRWDPQVGRACDAGLFVTGLPDALREPLAALVGAGS